MFFHEVFNLPKGLICSNYQILLQEWSFCVVTWWFVCPLPIQAQSIKTFLHLSHYKELFTKVRSSEEINTYWWCIPGLYQLYQQHFYDRQSCCICCIDQNVRRYWLSRSSLYSEVHFNKKILLKVINNSIAFSLGERRRYSTKTNRGGGKCRE